ncbi:uncharacterized protein LOC126388653 [Epinephelus moara]|uniref:uncharacterized protein LOC126388653 n=1 Tax=Epinephelus moara TaxID=300413 RepID=UPI00214E8E27|nr:uncharacterized protein LOC126388653 [Epinephelus moara]
MGFGSEFQREGAAMEKALSPQVRCLVRAGSERRFPSDERRSREEVSWPMVRPLRSESEEEASERCGGGHQQENRRLRRHDPDDAPSDASLRDQLLLGLREGPLRQALKVYARRNPDETFAALRQEALTLDTETGNQQSEEASCLPAGFKLAVPATEVRGAGVTSPPEEMRATDAFIGQCPTIGVTIEGVGLSGLLDTGSQVTLMQQSLFEKHFTQAKLGKAPVVFRLRAANGLEIPYTSYAVLDLEVEGIEIPGRGIVIVKDEHCTHPLIVGMNVVTACWHALFKCRGKSALSPPQLKNRRVWKDAFATCQRVEVTMAEDGLLGYVRPASRRSIQVPPKSEVLVWGRARMGPRGGDYCALVEALPEASDVGVARTLAVVRKGRVPVRVCNPHPYSLSIGRYQKLGKLYHVDEADVHGSRDLSLSLEDDCVVEVALVDAAADQEDQKLPKEVSELTNRSDLSEQQQEELRTLLLKWNKVFAQHDEDFGRTDLVQHQIHTGDAAPVRERYRPLPPLMYKEMKTLLAGMLEKGVIRESCSPWAAPIVLVRKKDGSWRFCVDYRKLNAVTHKDAFPLPRIEETLTSLTQAEWFTTLDLASGYWQVEMDPQDREKTAFTTPLGLFEFERMPFGLCNAPATFQRLMQQCLSGQLAESLLVYLDDIIIYSPDFSSHLQHLDEVFKKLWQHGLKLRLDKCKLLQHEVKFLGHVVDQNGVRPDPDKISAVLDWPIPNTIRQVRAFLGLAGYYRRFVSGFAKVARPLNQLLTGIPANKRSETRTVQWSAECQKSFDALKTALTQAPVLAYADYSLPFIIYTDASNQGLGAVLAQVQEGRERVIAYASRSLHPTERNDANYSSFKLELLALKWAVTEKFKDYLTGARFTVFTDNNPVAHLQTARLGAVEQRWVAQLASFDYDIKYRSGKSNVNADALSRCPVTPRPADAPDEGSGTAAAPTSAAIELTPEGGDEGWASSEWEEAQAHDPDIQTVKRYVETRVTPKGPERQALSHGARKLLQQWKKLKVEGNLLCRKVCPSARCEEVWRRVHEAAANAGVDRTLARLRLRFYWAGMEGEVRQFHQGCVACSPQRERVEPRAPLNPISVSYPLEVVGLDFLSLGRPTDTYQNILVATDLFTRFAWAIPTHDQTAQTTRDEDTQVYSAVVFTVMKTGSGAIKDSRAAERQRIYAAVKAFGLD